jgi:hypothetical protein
MKRPICPVCLSRPCAVNYHKDAVPHFRSRCDACARKNRKIKPQKPRWDISGYKKKNVCDLCHFKAKYSAQMSVYHVDGDLNNTDIKNLKTLCRNCCVAVIRSDLPWRPGDLEPDH